MQRRDDATPLGGTDHTAWPWWQARPWEASYIDGAGFEKLASGPGTRSLTANVAWYVPNPGFAHLYSDFTDTVTQPISWVSG
jgi:hypothetical protein